MALRSAPLRRSLTTALSRACIDLHSSSRGCVRSREERPVRPSARALLEFFSIHLFCASIAFAGAPPPTDDLPSEASALLHIDIAIFDGVPMSDSALGSIRDELEEIFAGIGVQLGWVDREAFPQVRTESVEFRAHIMPIQPTTWGFRPRAMGTVLSPEPPYNVYIFFPTTVRTVKRLEGSHYGRYGASCRQVARAIARVTAHEIFHVLAPDLPHSKEGIMKRALNRNDLLLEKPLIDPAFADVSRQALLVANRAKRSRLGDSSGSSPGSPHH